MRDIKELREEINIINNEMFDLFIKRMEVSKEVAKYKYANGQEIFNAEREKEILDKFINTAPDEYKDDIAQFFRHLMNASKGLQYKVIVELDKSKEK